MCFERANTHLELAWPWLFIWLNQAVVGAHSVVLAGAQKDFTSQPVVFFASQQLVAPPPTCDRAVVLLDRDLGRLCK